MANEIPFESEFILHTLTQNNLKELFDLEFIASEIQLKDLRLDNLAFYEKTNSLVIIEYKNEFNADVLNQAKGYYNLVKENLKFFIDRLDDEIEDIRVMIIGPSFSPKQIDETGEDFELWKVTLFDDGKVTYEKLGSNEIKTLHINLDDLKLTQETMLDGKSEETIELYKDFKNKLSNEFDDLDIKFLVDAISIKAYHSFICLITVKNSIKIIYYAEELEDTENKTRDISGITTGGPLANYELTLNSKNMDYAIDLIKQVYNQKVKK